MAVGGRKEDADFDPQEEDLEWWAEIRWNIKDVRNMYSSIDYYQSIWPGEPDRPKKEKKFLEVFKGKLFAMITDYNFHHHEVEVGEDDSTPSGNDT